MSLKLLFSEIIFGELSTSIDITNLLYHIGPTAVSDAHNVVNDNRTGLET